jgi:hypothetical protein
VKENEAADPINICVFGSNAVMLDPDGISHLLK